MEAIALTLEQQDRICLGRCPLLRGVPADGIARVLDEPGSKPVSMQIHYLKPIEYEEYAGMKPAELAQLVKSRIAEKIQECTGGCQSESC